MFKDDTMKTLVLYIASALCFTVPAPALALSCAPVPLEEYKESAEVIFSGTVSSIGARGTDSMSTTAVEFDVSEAWKGVDEGAARLTVHISEWDMNLIEEGKVYLLYATHSEFGLLHVNPCGGRIIPDDQSAQDRVLLGEAALVLNPGVKPGG
jgi:hypothetical protein